MRKAVARLNIEHFRRLLGTEIDEAKRSVILRLLAEEEANLAALTDPPTASDAEDPNPLPTGTPYRPLPRS
jgi:hypothetical protein